MPNLPDDPAFQEKLDRLIAEHNTEQAAVKSPAPHMAKYLMQGGGREPGATVQVRSAADQRNCRVVRRSGDGYIVEHDGVEHYAVEVETLWETNIQE